MACASALCSDCDLAVVPASRIFDNTRASAHDKRKRQVQSFHPQESSYAFVGSDPSSSTAVIVAPAEVTAMAKAPNGKQLAVGYADGSVSAEHWNRMMRSQCSMQGRGYQRCSSSVLAVCSRCTCRSLQVLTWPACLPACLLCRCACGIPAAASAPSPSRAIRWAARWQQHACMHACNHSHGCTSPRPALCSQAGPCCMRAAAGAPLPAAPSHTAMGIISHMHSWPGARPPVMPAFLPQPMACCAMCHA
jgi:hypothetical protein